MPRITYPFAAVPNQVCRGGHGAINIAVLATLLSHGTTTASAQTIAKEIGCSRASVFTSIKYWLENGEKYGIFLKADGRGSKSGNVTIYEISIASMGEGVQPVDGGCLTNRRGGVQPVDTKKNTIKNNPKEEYATPLASRLASDNKSEEPSPFTGKEPEPENPPVPQPPLTELNQLLKVFADNNPFFKWANKTERTAAEELLKTFGLEEALNLANVAMSVRGKPYAPVITTPWELKTKLLKLQAYIEKTQSSGVNGWHII